jgi:Ca-activated chloride channel family protein
MQIAEATDGKYYNAESEEELRTIYREIEPELTVKAEEMEITSMLAGVSLLVFLAGGALSLLWFSRIP